MTHQVLHFRQLLRFLVDPSLNGLVLVGAVVGRNNRIVHDVARDRTQKLLGGVASFRRHCCLHKITRMLGLHGSSVGLGRLLSNLEELQ